MRTSKYDQNRPHGAPNAKETGLYYLQSRYYNPEWGRFINADAFDSTGQGLLGNNMFAYCGNNPIRNSDSSGHAFTDALGGLRNKFCADTDIECYGGGGAAAACGSFLLIDKAFSYLKDLWETFTGQFAKKSDHIDWGGGDTTHILKGTDGKHIDGWRRFGIDPGNGDNNGNWIALLPLLQEVVDDADYYTTQTNPNGTICTLYYKTFIEAGVIVMVKIWESIDGLIQRISDAIPYIIN